MSRTVSPGEGATVRAETAAGPTVGTIARFSFTSGLRLHAADGAELDLALEHLRAVARV